MTLVSLLNLPCTITHRLPGATTDDYGNAIPNEESLETFCDIQQTGATEPDDAGETSVANFDAFFLPGTLLATGDTVTAEGEDYEVVGDPWRARNPRLGLHQYVKANLRRATATDDEVAS